MSFPENGRKDQSNTGKALPIDRRYGQEPFAEAIATALKADLGGSPSAVKRLARAVDANERAVRNWLEGRNGPTGENLVNLMRHSDAVCEAVLAMTGRKFGVNRAGLVKLRGHLVEGLQAIDEACLPEA